MWETANCTRHLWRHRVNVCEQFLQIGTQNNPHFANAITNTTPESMKVAIEKGINKMDPQNQYDFCIVGAGPAGLATLSALSESYSLGEGTHLNDAHWSIRKLSSASSRNRNARRNRKHKICVIDPNPEWMHCWDKNYDTLEIEYLRSPVTAHPDAFDVNSLFAYAHSKGRSEDELLESHSLGGLKGNKKLLSLGEPQIGLWDLPSAKLFRDFCDDALIKRHPHDYLQGEVLDIDRDCDNGTTTELPFSVTIKKHGCEKGVATIAARAVILAMGAIGRPIIPKCLEDLPPSKLVHWQRLKDDNEILDCNMKSVLVVGGGLTAVQTAQFALRRYPNLKQVVLCSRRPITEKNFDVSEDWFDRRSSKRLIGDFYHRPVDERLKILKQARGGGSVPSAYMDDIRHEATKTNRKLICLDGDIVISGDECEEEKKDEYCPNTYDTPSEKISVTIVESERADVQSESMQERTKHQFDFDQIWLACGIQPDCTQSSLIRNLLMRWPIETVGGFLSVSEDLEWSEKQCPNLHVVGSLSSLNTGPDAANLMGIRRSAGTVANALDLRSWLREEYDEEDVKTDTRSGSGILTNPFSQLISEWDSDDTDHDDVSTSSSVCE